ncbi:MAG: DeoR/GlpR transcriptional regulator [Desulfobulbaceae bacterium]|mgnify:CR=1 FL=1|nr:MAG: DeoR/GlpR transcriptional regulator [Desulfobulbaceae bacterium]
MQNLNARQKKILAIAREQGKVAVEKLSSRFSVSAQTIRKDINTLCKNQFLQRVHGGAIVGSGIEHLSYEARKVLAPEAKKAIGKKAAKLIPNNVSILLNIGTTTEEVAHALKRHRGLLVISNNINAVEILRHSSGIDVVISGGLVRKSDGGLVGEAAVDFINQFKADYAVIGVSAIDVEGALLDYDYREVRVAKAIIANARQVVLVADELKFSRNASIRIGHLSQIDTLVTNTLPPENIQNICKTHEVNVEIAET